MSKRRRQTRASRPIDKQIKVIDHSITASQDDTTLLDILFPATLVGLRWNLSYINQTTASNATFAWAIVVVRDGETASTMSIGTDGATFYAPEQNCLTFGIVRTRDADATNADISFQWEGSTKTMRKLSVGDELHWIGIGEVASQGEANGIIQFFTKS